MKFLKKFYKGCVKNHLPKPLRKSISSFMSLFHEKNAATEHLKIALKNWNKIWFSTMFPYPWANDYKHKNFLCKKDESSSLFFIEDCGVKLYFSKKIEYEESVQNHAVGMSLEQDLFSAHRYVTKENKMWGTLERKENEIPEEVPFFVEKDDIVADIGASCGNFSISVIENAKHIYLFEADDNWNEPLQKTFEKYKDKVTIVNKYVSDANSENSVTLDTFFKDKEINFIKVDVDGYEQQLLNGAKNILQRENVKFSICTYHKPQDAKDLKKIFKKLGYKTYFTDSYIFFPLIWEKGHISLNTPLTDTSYFRKAVLRARKEASWV